MRFTTTTLLFLLLPVIASAHHSRAEFSADIQEIEAELVAVAWRNPHPVLTLKVVNDAGEDELWRVEAWQSANALTRKGVTGTVFPVGERIIAAVQASNRREHVLLGMSISLGDGTQAILRPGFEPFWTDQAVLGSEAAAALQRQEAFDELSDHPLWNCDPVGMPVATEPVVVRANWEWIPGETVESWNCAVSDSVR